MSAANDLTELERSVLGTLLINNRHLPRLIRTREIHAEQFSASTHRAIWIAMADLTMRGKIANPITVRDWLRDTNLGSPSDAKYLASLAGCAASLGGAESLFQKWRAAHPDFWEWYSEYLNSAEWQLVRAKVMARCRGFCEGCGEARATQVHHLTYAHVGEEFLFELVGLCDACHDRIHPDRHDR
jgi:5-methylcytosine-specific restriction endonuclease McrA